MVFVFPVDLGRQPWHRRVGPATETHAGLGMRGSSVGIPADEMAQILTRFFRALTARAMPGIAHAGARVRAVAWRRGRRRERPVAARCSR
jgi:hypothetical protein